MTHDPDWTVLTDFDPNWEADATLLLQAGHGAPGRELMRLLKWEIERKTQLLYVLQDPNDAGNVCKSIGALEELHKIWARLSGELIPLEEELDD